MTISDKAMQVKAAVSAALAFGTSIFGWVGWVIILWLCAMVLDYITGSLAAISQGNWSSSEARKGLWHKLGSIAAVLVAALCDIAFGVIGENIGLAGFSSQSTCLITPAVTAWYIFTELGSVIENASELGAPMPEFLKRRLVQLRNSAENSEADDND